VWVRLLEHRSHLFLKKLKSKDPRKRYIYFAFGDGEKKGQVTKKLPKGRPAAAAAKIRSCHSSSSARQGKRDKYS
jgi:hypothetical protein